MAFHEGHCQVAQWAVSVVSFHLCRPSGSSGALPVRSSRQPHTPEDGIEPASSRIGSSKGPTRSNHPVVEASASISSSRSSAS